jgi:hypothetical protein
MWRVRGIENIIRRVEIDSAGQARVTLQFPQPSPLFVSHGQGGIVWIVAFSGS